MVPKKRKRAGRPKKIPSAGRGLVVHHSYDPTRHLYPNEPPRTTSNPTEPTELESSMQSVVIFKVDTPERRALKEAHQPRTQGLRRCVTRGRKGTFAKRDTPVTGGTTCGMDVQTPRCSSPIHHGSGIHIRLRRSEGPPMGETVPRRAGNQPTDTTNPPDGQQGSSLPHQNNEVPVTFTPYRTPFPLYPTTSEEREPLCQNDTRNGEPSRPADETPTSTENNGLDCKNYDSYYEWCGSGKRIY